MRTEVSEQDIQCGLRLQVRINSQAPVKLLLELIEFLAKVITLGLMFRCKYHFQTL
jgi:hypothetical protein